ncbi:MAG: histidine kinase [Bacteroidota bacterium]
MRRFWQYIFPGLYGLLIYLTIRVINDTLSGDWDYFGRPLWLNAVEVVGSTFFGYVLMRTMKRMEEVYFHRLGEEITLTRIALELLSVIGLTVASVHLTFIPLASMTDDGLSWADYAQINIIPSMYALMYFGVRRSNFYIRQYIASQRRLDQMEKDALQSELDFLKAQFSPHFLFNSLNNIYFQMAADVPAAQESVQQLSELLRYQLYQDQQQTVPLRKEGEFIRLYAQVHKKRRAEGLALRLELEESDTLVFPHLFLPLVENAFKYVEGESPFLEIGLAEADGAVHFRVRNSCRAGQAPRAEGIGLKNLHRRLDLLYPEQYTLVAQEVAGVFSAELTLRIA